MSESSKSALIRGVIAAAASLAILLCLMWAESALNQGNKEAFAVGASANTVSADANAEGSFTPGTYTQTANGFGGPVEVAITIGDNGGIADAVITGNDETPDVGGAAIPELRNQILTAQSAEIDGVSGASFTTGAVKEAAGKALAEAGGQAVETGPKAEEGNLFIPGTYTGTSKGFGGDVEVTVTVSENKIEDLKVVGDHETENIGSFAVSMLPERILTAQTTNVDALSGATVTSSAIFRALQDALTQAGCDLSKLPAAEKVDENAPKTDETLDCDICIVGAGGAGMTAAINPPWNRAPPCSSPRACAVTVPFW